MSGKRCFSRRRAALTFAAFCFVAMPVFVAPGDAQSPRPDAANRRAAEGNLVGHGGPVKAIALSSDGTRVLTGAFDYAAMLWDISVPTPKSVRRFADHNGAVNAAVFVGQNQALTAGDDSLVRLWDLDSGTVLHRFEGHDAGSKIVALDVSPDGQWAVSAGWDRTARIWNLATRTAGPVLKDHNASLSAAVFSADSTVVYTSSADGFVRAFNRQTGDTLRHVVSMGQGVTVLHRLRLNEAASDHLLVGAVSGQSAIIDGRTGVTVSALADVERPILAASSGNGHIALGSGDGRIRLFKHDTFALVEDYKNPFGPVWALAMRSRADAAEPMRLYYGGLDDFVTLWQASPRASFEPVDASHYPRRFQLSGTTDDPIAKGEIQFARKCSICHTLTPDSANRAGPTLHHVFGRRIATLQGYPFSPELKTLDIVWSAETIAKLFELGPDKFTPGSKMPLQVMSDKAERDALIAFLAVATK